MMNIVQMSADTVETAAALAQKLWPDAEALREEFAGALSNPEFAVFLAYVDGVPRGFAQCQLRRDYVEGCSTSPVGYLEGLYVEEACRGRGAARALLARCEVWAKALGCTEFASDCELTNVQSIAFHKSVGFLEENRIVCFRKEI